MMSLINIIGPVALIVENVSEAIMSDAREYPVRVHKNLIWKE